MRISRFLVPLIAAVAVLMLGQAAYADLLIAVDKSSQRMTVTVNGEQLYEWAVSTGGPDMTLRTGPSGPFAWKSTTTAMNGTMRLCPIRSSSPRPEMPFTAPTSNAI
jgi:hypothetical protein